MNYFNNDKLNDRFPMPDANASGAAAAEGGEGGAAAGAEGGEGSASESSEGADGAGAAEGSEGAAGAGESGEGGEGGASEGAAGSEGAGASEGAAAKPELTKEEKDKIFADYLAEQGLGSLDEIKALKDKAAGVPETEEEKQARIAEYNNSVTAFGISNKLLSNADITEMETIKTLSDRDLAKKEFASEYRDANKDRKIEGTEDLEPVTDDEIDAAFEELYHLESSNSALKAKGEKMMQSRAEAIRSGTDIKFQAAKEKYDAQVHSQTNIPLYNKFLDETIAGAIPEKLTIYKDADNEVVFDLAEADGKKRYDTEELKKLFVNDLVYDKFLAEKDKTGLQAYINTVVKSHIHEVNRDAMNKLIFEQGKNVGTKAGSTTGAKAPFKAHDKIPPVPTTDKVLTDGDKSSLKNQFQSRR